MASRVGTDVTVNTAARSAGVMAEVQNSVVSYTSTSPVPSGAWAVIVFVSGMTLPGSPAASRSLAKPVPVIVRETRPETQPLGGGVD
jgi:hypothetical protein